MNEPMVRLPVKRPECGIESVGSFPVAEIAAALIADQKIRLHAMYHNRSWDASTWVPCGFSSTGGRCNWASVSTAPSENYPTFA